MIPAHRKCLLLIVLLLLPMSRWESARAQSASQPGTPKPKSIPSDPSPTAAMNTSISNQLTGTWRLVAYQEKLSNGDTVNPYGDTPQGEAAATNELMPMIYERLCTIAHRQLVHAPQRQTLSTTDLVHEAYLAYYGTWAVDEGHSVVVENIRASNQPFLNNQITTQRYDFDGKRLSLRTVLDNHGDEHSILFVWDKIH